jgi:hypothetical protein
MGPSRSLTDPLLPCGAQTDWQRYLAVRAPGAQGQRTVAAAAQSNCITASRKT